MIIAERLTAGFCSPRQHWNGGGRCYSRKLQLCVCVSLSPPPPPPPPPPHTHYFLSPPLSLSRALFIIFYPSLSLSPPPHPPPFGLSLCPLLSPLYNLLSISVSHFLSICPSPSPSLCQSHLRLSLSSLTSPSLSPPPPPPLSPCVWQD